MINSSQILIYQSSEGNIKVDVHLEDETVWLTQAQMAELFDKGWSTITEHISNIFKEGELDEKVVLFKEKLRLRRLNITTSMSLFPSVIVLNPNKELSSEFGRLSV